MKKPACAGRKACPVQADVVRHSGVSAEWGLPRRL